MTEAKHTPGPWTFQASECGDVIWIGNENENAACVPGFSDHPGNVADARLIAAAPDMLEALIALGTVLDFDFEAPPCGCFEDASALNTAMAKGRAAIAKARGG